MYQWILPSLAEILAQSQSHTVPCSSEKAEQQWRVGLAAAEHLLLTTLTPTTPHHTTPGLVLTAPTPLFGQPNLTQNLQTVTFATKPFNPLALMPFDVPQKVLADQGNLLFDQDTIIKNNTYYSHLYNNNNSILPDNSILPLLAPDPLGNEQFCLVFTENFTLALVLSAPTGSKKECLFSFEPNVVKQAWQALGTRLVLTNPELFSQLDAKIGNYPLTTPNYQIIIQFSQFLLAELPESIDRPTHSFPTFSFPQDPVLSSAKPPSRSDVELLQAFSHEVRTPLTTIRTMTRLLLKRQDLPGTVVKRLEVIDHECTEQIDRMELLFKAAELETSETSTSQTAQIGSQLTPMSLNQILEQIMPRWQQAATRRNLTLDVALPQQLPTVVSNPAMLDRVLTGLMESFTRSLPPGSSIQVQVIPAGHQLKLQLLPLLPRLGCHNSTKDVHLPVRKALGQLLIFQPETGTISLNVAATKHLFQSIGGKLIVRQNSQHGEVMTIFLPLEIDHKHSMATS